MLIECLEGEALAWGSSLALMGKFVPSMAYLGNLIKKFEELSQLVGESVETYARNFKLMLKEMPKALGVPPDDQIQEKVVGAVQSTYHHPRLCWTGQVNSKIQNTGG